MADRLHTLPVTNLYAWYSSEDLHAAGVPPEAGDELFTHPFRLEHFNGDRHLLGAFVLSYLLGRRLITSDMVADHSIDLLFVEPTQLARTLEVPPDYIAHGLELTHGEGQKYIKNMQVAGGSRKLSIGIEELIHLRAPVVDHTRLELLTDEEIVLRYRLSEKSLYEDMLMQRADAILEAVLKENTPVKGRKALRQTCTPIVRRAVSTYDLTQGDQFEAYMRSVAGNEIIVQQTTQQESLSTNGTE